MKLQKIEKIEKIQKEHKQLKEKHLKAMTLLKEKYALPDKTLTYYLTIDTECERVKCIKREKKKKERADKIFAPMIKKQKMKEKCHKLWVNKYELEFHKLGKGRTKIQADKRKELIINMHDDGFIKYDIAKYIGMDKSTVLHHLKKRK